MTRFSILLVGLLLAGCVNLDLRPALVDPTVKPILQGEDCAYQILVPILAGSLSVEQAMQNSGRSIESTTPGSRQLLTVTVISTPITKVHSIEIQQRGFLIFSSTCIHVTGE